MDTAAALAGWRATHVLVDHYLLDARWHRRVRQSLGVQMVAIDDLADRELAVDVLVDPKWAGSGGKVPRSNGPRPACWLAPASRCWRSRTPMRPRRVRDAVRSMGICMGGADPAGSSSAY